MLRVVFRCPSCGVKFNAVTALESATTVYKRTCRNKVCRETWQLVVRCIGKHADARFDSATMTYLGNKRK